MTTTRAVEFSLPVTGLTSENLDTAIAPLRAFTVREYFCPKCQDTRMAAGECRPCQTRLDERTRPAFTDVMASPDHVSIRFRVATGAWARLTSIENSLRASNVAVKRDALTISSPAGLIFSGGSAAEDATRLDKAIRTAGHTDVVTRFDPDSREVHAAFERNPPTWTKLTEIATSMSERPLRLSDVIWNTRVART